MKEEKRFSKDLIIRIVVTAFLVTIFCLIYFFQFEILCFFDKSGYCDIAKEEFEVCFFDVGQGDSTLIKYKDISILIDAGTSSSANSLSKEVADVNRGNEIDYFFLTHADSDHTGGGRVIFEKFDVRNFYRPIILSSSENKKYGDPNNYGVDDGKCYDESIMSAYVEKDCKIFYTTAQRVIYEGDFSLDVIYPIDETSVDQGSSNSYSTIIKVRYKNFTYLFMADANTTIENSLVDEYGEELDCDVLKVSHHGSKNGSTAGFLNYATPRYAIISVGTYGINHYGHAGEEVKTRLTNVGAEIYQTNEVGNILIGGNNILIHTFHETPSLHITVVSVFFGVFVLAVWGIKVKKKTKKRGRKN